MLRHSQISPDSDSRTPRAFSRAAASEPAIADGLPRSYASRSSTSRMVAGSGSGPVSRRPITVATTVQVSVSSTAGSTMIWWKCTSSSRAVSSARSAYRPIQNSASAARLSTGPVPSSRRAACPGSAPGPLLLLLLGLFGGRTGVGRLRRQRPGEQVRRRRPPAGGRGREVSTQVSLDPPPCEELTTRLPSRSATRVSPPGST